MALGDNTGTLQTQYTYEPFGYVTESGQANTNSYKYTGREDDGSGLDYYRARYYHPRLQRFIAEDPSEFSGGDMNLYAYVKNNPLSFVDPLGLQSHPPPPGIPGGPWNWSPDPGNSRGGAYKDPNGRSASFDYRYSHWDVDQGNGTRLRYDIRGNLLNDLNAHNYRGPKQKPIVVKKGKVLQCLGPLGLIIGLGLDYLVDVDYAE